MIPFTIFDEFESAVSSGVPFKMQNG